MELDVKIDKECQADIYSANVTNSFQSAQFPTFIFCRFLQFSQKVYMMERLTIPHFKALIIGSLVLEGKRHGIIRKGTASL